MRTNTQNMAFKTGKTFGSPLLGRTNEADTLNGYRFGMNTQEKDDEIYGKGNASSAEFWEYDSRLGRRWNQDPKPNPSISNYACFANNPIFITDPLGDEIKIKYGGFLGIGRKTATYKDGKYLDKKGNEITSENKFFNVIKQGISDLNSKPEGAKIVDELAKSEKIFTIKWKPGTFDDGLFKSNNNKAAATLGIGSGGTLRMSKRWSSRMEVMTTLGHEMSHAMASDQGKADLSTWFQVTGDTKKIVKDEQIAMFYENLIRAEHGLTLREYYHPETLQGPKSETHGL